MTEQEARKLFRSLATPAEGSLIPTICLYESEAIEFAKAYAASQLTAKDAEIEALKAANALSSSGWRKDCEQRDAEIEELNRLVKLNQLMVQGGADLLGYWEDENKRLREGIAKVSIACKSRDTTLNWAHLSLESLLSPSPVTEEPKAALFLQMYECNHCEWSGQVGEAMETESYDICPKCLSEDLILYDSPKNED